MDALRRRLLEANPDLQSDTTQIKWRRWVAIKTKSRKSGKDLTKHVIIDVTGTRMQLLEQYIKDMRDISLHLFNWNWHDAQFEYFKENLQDGKC